MGGIRKWWPAALLLLAAGCGQSSSGSGLVPVYGKVSFRGQPLAGGTIVFAPDQERGGRGPLGVGTIDAQGHYILQSEGKPGVTPGWHRVTVAASSAAGAEGASLLRHYTDPEQSGIAKEVEAGKPNIFDFALE
jgi:hypothetical protein